MNERTSISEKIKQIAFSIGFDACGICKAEKIDKEEQLHLSEWLRKGYQADMD